MRNPSSKPNFSDDQVCECSDKGCLVHPGKSHCEFKGVALLFRVDMDDTTGTLFCQACAEDAISSGLFCEGVGEED